MKAGYVTVNDVPTRVVTCGGWLKEAFTDPDCREMVLIIPGNPGLTGYYEEFVNYIYKAVQMPVWILSHAGHELSCNGIYPSVKDFPELFDLEGQIKHKAEFIKKYIPEDVKIHLVGHSVGCYIILNILKNNLITNPIQRAYMLFPAIERIGITPNGKFLQLVANYFLWLLLFLSWIFQKLPIFIGRFLVGTYFLCEGTLLHHIGTTMHLINPVILRNIFFLAMDEMVKIQELDQETIERFNTKLLFYYGQKDGWCPLQYYVDLKKTFPHANAVACTRGIQHAFVLTSGRKMAEIIGKLIIEWN